MTLDEALDKPGNNLAFVRILAASMVLFSHSFVLNKLVQDEPLARLPDATRELPGVFSALPLAGMVNGSLWTIRVEFMLYLIVAFLGWVALLQTRAVFNSVALIMLVASVTIGSIPILGWDHFSSLYAGCFLLGAFLYVNRRYVPLR